MRAPKVVRRPEVGAAIVEIDFTKVRTVKQLPSGVLRSNPSPIDGDNRPVNNEGKLLTPKQIRARARRRAAKVKKGTAGKKLQVITEEEFNALYKPVEEWDFEELSRGRPRDVNGTFGGRTPGWITREVQENALTRFSEMVKGRMNSLTIKGLDTIEYLLEDNSVDDKGKPIIPASTKFQVAQFTVEHVIGKPKQHIEQDISVKLQGILGSVMVNPNEALAPPTQGGSFGDADTDTPGYSVAHLPGHTIPMGTSEMVDGEVVWSDDD